MLKKYSIDAELAGHAHKLDMKRQSVWEWFFSGCWAHACQVTNNTMKTKMGYISLLSIWNAIIDINITSYYCIILKIVILHGRIKAIENGVFLFSLKKENLVSFKKI